MNRPPLLITVDGTTASGKGTLAQMLAKTLSYDFFSTGNIYRIVALYAINHNIALNDESALTDTAKKLKWEDVLQLEHSNQLLSSEVSKAASIVSAIKPLRAALIEIQRNIPNHKGLILDGRDVGTVIFPNADCKFFIDADLETRAHRRFKQLQEKNKHVIYDDVFKEVRDRDQRDKNRAVAPLVPANNAHVIHTTNMDTHAAHDAMLKIINKVAG